MNILWGVLGFLWCQNTRCSLGGSSREPQEHSLPSVCPSVPITAAAPSSGGTPSPQDTQLHHLTPACRRGFLGDKQEQGILCQWSSSLSCEGFLGEECGVCFTDPNRRGEGSCKSHLRFPQQHHGISISGMLEKQEPVQTPREWAAQAARDRISGGFSARRSSKNKIHEPSSRTPSAILEGCVWAGCCTLRSACSSADPSATFQFSKRWWLQPGFLQSNSPVSKCEGNKLCWHFSWISRPCWHKSGAQCNIQPAH